MRASGASWPGIHGDVHDALGAFSTRALGAVISSTRSPHQALDDIRESVRELQHYRQSFLAPEFRGDGRAPS